VTDYLVVDLRGRGIETLDEFWDAVTEPCGLPEWFGRNIDAWHDTIRTRGISDIIDRHDAVVIHVDREGLFLVGTTRPGRGEEPSPVTARDSWFIRHRPRPVQT
jgi:Barstar (barnase inhibitor)